MGEGIGSDANLMPWISSCSISCGAHAGDEYTIRKTIRLAKKHGVKIGAHPGYPDKENFGRMVMDISKKTLQKSIKKQLNSFSDILKKEGGELHHIKAHGALYHQLAKNKALAFMFLDALKNFTKIPLYVPFCSEIAKAATNRGFQILYEAFADRNYNADLTLVSRKDKNALLQNPTAILQHILKMVKKNQVLSVQGVKIHIQADTFCIHGDTPNALEILKYLHQKLPNYNIQIAR